MMDGYKKLNFIDKIKYHYRVCQAEKAEDERQAFERDDYFPVDKQEKEMNY